MTKTQHCNMYGHMDYSNLQIIGITLADTDKSDDTNQYNDSRQYILVDYFPQEDASYFFTFAVGAEKHDIFIDYPDPMQIDTFSPACTVLLGNCNVVSGTVDGSLVIWNLKTQMIEENLQDRSLTKQMRSHNVQCLNVSGMPAHESKVTCVSSSLSQLHLASGGADCKIRVWNWKQRDLSSVLTGHTGVVSISSISTVIH